MSVDELIEAINNPKSKSKVTKIVIRECSISLSGCISESIAYCQAIEASSSYGKVYITVNWNIGLGYEIQKGYVDSRCLKEAHASKEKGHLIISASSIVDWEQRDKLSYFKHSLEDGLELLNRREETALEKYREAKENTEIFKSIGEKYG